MNVKVPHSSWIDEAMLDLPASNASFSIQEPALPENRAGSLFFLIGMPRSGTTLLQQFLDAHRHMKVSLEFPGILEILKPYGEDGFDSPQEIKTCIDYLYAKSSGRSFPLKDTSKEIITEWALDQYPNLSFKQLVFKFIKRHRSFHPSSKIEKVGIKVHNGALQLNRLQKCFPTAKFVHLIRDPRGCVNSFQKLKPELSPIAVAHKWVRLNKSVEKFKSQHPGNVLSVRYEKLVKNPKIELNKICQFLKVPFDPKMLNFRDNLDIEVLSGLAPSKKSFLQWHPNLNKPLDISIPTKWKRELDPIVRENVSRISKGMYGYTANSNRISPVFPTVSAIKSYLKWNLFYPGYYSTSTQFRSNFFRFKRKVRVVLYRKGLLSF